MRKKHNHFMAGKKANILITGAAGFVGRALAERLSRGGNNLFLVSRNRKFKYPGAKIFYGDLCDKNFCRQILKGIDIIYYLAGYKKNLAHHLSHPFDFVLRNVEPMIVFLKSLRRSKVKKLIYLSSSHVGRDWENENDGYAAGKFVNELILLNFAKQSAIEIKIIRSAPIYGPGDNFNPETANFIPATIDKVVRADKEFTMWGSGKRKLQFIFIDDLINNLLAVGQVKKTKNLFIFGNNETAAVEEIIKKIMNIFGKKLVIKKDLAKPDKISRLFKFNNLINPRFSLNQGLKETIRYYRKING